MVGTKALGQEQGKHNLEDSRGVSRTVAESARKDMVKKWSPEQWGLSPGLVLAPVRRGRVCSISKVVSMVAQRVARTLRGLSGGGVIYGSTWGRS